MKCVKAHQILLCLVGSRNLWSPTLKFRAPGTRVLSWSMWFVLSFLTRKATLEVPSLLKLGHMASDEITLCELILSQLCW